MKEVREYLLYIQTEKGQIPNWSIEKYSLYHDLQDRMMTLELQKKPFKVVIEYTDNTKEELN